MGHEEIIELPELEDFPPGERTPAVKLLLGICHRQQQEIVELRERVRSQEEQIQILREQNVLQAEEIRCLKDEIAILKGEKGRPNIRPSGLSRNTQDGQKDR